LAVLGVALVVLGVGLTVLLRPSADRPGSGTHGERAYDAATSRAAGPGVGHVFVINIENKGYHTTWGKDSKAPYLARHLRARGVLLTHYYGTAHHSLGNYLAQVSGQGPSYDIQHDCARFAPFVETRPVVAPGQVVGHGCVFPRKVRTVGNQLTSRGHSWRAYLQDMGRPCQHPRVGSADPWRSARRDEQYVTRHNPFVYFRSVISRPAYCRSHDVSLKRLGKDLRRVSTTRSLSYITPDLCHDAHDAHCADGGPGGLRAANAFLRTWVPRILASPAFRRDGMLVITADESESVREDSRACCGEGPGPNAGQPGIEGPGGGRIGALVISPFTAPGTSTGTPYNHYSLLATVEDLFGLPRLGYARTVTRAFGADVFNAG